MCHKEKQTPKIVHDSHLDICTESEIIEKDIQGAVVHKYLNEKQLQSGNGDLPKVFSSSDTVNELLQGLTAIDSDASICKLKEETAEVLPSFSKALGKSNVQNQGIYVF